MEVMSEPIKPTYFEQELESIQSLLIAYIRTMVPPISNANDILQETNLVLIRKKDQFETGTSFWHWAKKVAYFQILAHWKKQKRNRLVFDEDLILQIEDEIDQLHEINNHQDRLKVCLQKLPEKQAEMIRLHYFKEMGLNEIVEVIKSNKEAISAILYRARKNLFECIKKSN